MVGFWDVISNIANVLGILSFGVSIITLFIAGGIKRSMMAHVESTDYRKEIQEHIAYFESCRELMVEDKSSIETYYGKLVARLDVIKTAYETILSPKLIKKINSLTKQIETSMSNKSQHATRNQISQLAYIITELKKKEKMI